MFLRFVLTLVVSALVPYLGLSSCSKDRTDDTWSLAEPTLIAGSVSYPVSSADHRTLPLATEMKFNGAEWASLKINSTCQLDGVTFSDSFSLSPRDSLEIKSLWPRTMTERFGDQDLRKSTCEFSFVAANEQGSTHDFKIAGVKLETFVDQSERLNLRAALKDSTAQAPLSLTRDAALLTSATEDLVESLGSATHVALVCGGRYFKTELGAQTTEHALAAVLTEAALSGQQVCHLSASEEGSELNAFALSADVLVRFSNLQLEVTVSKNYPNPNFGDQSLEKVVIHNSNTEPAHFFVPETPPVVRVREIYLYQENLFANPTDASYELKAVVQGATQVSEGHYLLAASSTATVELQLTDRSRDCNPVSATTNHAGLQWGFTQPYVIQLIDDPDDASGTHLFSAPTFKQPTMYPESFIATPFQSRFGTTVPGSIQYVPSGVLVDRCL